MFCPYCGSQTADGASFCVACGKNIASVAPTQPAQPAVDFQANKNAVRQSEINALSKAIRYFSEKQSEFEEYDLVCDLVNDFSRGAKSSLLVWGCIITTFGLFSLLAVAAEDPSILLPVFLILALPGMLMIAGGILMKVNSKRKYRYFQSEYARLSQELYEHYINYPDCPVGPEYANPEILTILLDIIQSGRADTIKESINLAISDSEQREMNDYLNMIEQNTAAINAQTRVAAFFAAANFFK